MKIKIIVSIIIFLSISLVSYSQNIYIDYALQKIINSNKIQTPHDENGIRIINKNPCIDIAIKDSSYYILFNNNMAILNINGESEMYNLPRNAVGQISQYSSDIFKHNRDFNLLIKGKKSLWVIDKKNLVFLKKVFLYRLRNIRTMKHSQPGESDNFQVFGLLGILKLIRYRRLQVLLPMLMMGKR